MVDIQTNPPPGAEPILLTSRRDTVLTLTLNRPRSGNSLSREMIAQLQRALADANEDDSVNVIVIAASGKVFCSGHDLRESLANDNPRYAKDLTTACGRLMVSMTEQRQPIIARVHGVATAAGCQLVASCDLAIAAEDARFGTPGVNIGFWCSLPMVALSRAVSRKHALEMLLTGRLMSAQTALRFGLVNDVVPAAELDEAVYGIADEIASKSRYTVALGKRAFYRQLPFDLAGAYEYASELSLRNRLAEDAREGVQAFLEKRKPVWKGR